MNRRGFFRRTIGAIAAAVCASLTPRVSVPMDTLADLPYELDTTCDVVFDRYECVIHGVYKLRVDNPRRLGVIAGIS